MRRLLFGSVLQSFFIFCVHGRIGGDGAASANGDILKPNVAHGVTTPIFLSDVLQIKNGLSMTRNISSLPSGSSFFLEINDNHCSTQDEYGADNCNWEWGQIIQGHYKLVLVDEVEDGDYMTGHFKLDKVIPYEFTCKLCGEDCIIKIPIVDFEYTIPMLPCPIASPHVIENPVDYQLWDTSPTGGILTHLEGTVKVMKQSGDLLTEFSFSAYAN